MAISLLGMDDLLGFLEISRCLHIQIHRFEKAIAQPDFQKGIAFKALDLTLIIPVGVIETDSVTA
jgi:hypothetical protein